MDNLKEDIAKRVKRIFLSRFELNFNDLEYEMQNKNLLSGDMGFFPRHLLYLYFDIEKEFEIQIPQEDIVNGKFDTFNNIVEIIMKQLVLKEKLEKLEEVI